MSKTKITATRDHVSLRVYIDDLLHFQVKVSGHTGVQSWIECAKKCSYYVYCIEFYRMKGKPIKMKYHKREIWEQILKLIDENI